MRHHDGLARSKNRTERVGTSAGRRPAVGRFFAVAAIPCLVSASVLAEPVRHTLTLSNVNWTSGGVGGIGNPANNRDLAFFEGNDSNVADNFPGEEDGWNAVLSPINYGGGSVFAELHVADGQDSSDGTLTFQTPNGNLVIPDTNVLFDGVSVPDAGNSRSSEGSLWDIHRFDITAAFGGVPGPVALTLNGSPVTSDCLALIVAVLDLEAGSAPAAPGQPLGPVEIPVAGPAGLVLLALGMLAAAGRRFRQVRRSRG